VYTPHAPTTPSTDAYAHQYLARLSRGELGALPALGGLIACSTVFALLRPAFLSPANLANLVTQAATIGIIAMGLVFVLLLGEIDLSVGYTSGVCGAVAARLAGTGWLPWYVAVAGALLTGAAIGTTLGLLVVRTRMPSFIVTLAALLGLQGVALLLIGGGINISIQDKALLAIANGDVTPALGWLFWVAGVAMYVMIEFRRKRKGVHHRGAAADPMPVIAWRISLVTVLSAVMVFVLNLERSPHPDIATLRGVPIVVPVTAALIMWWTFVLRRTAYGRRLYVAGRDHAAHRPSPDAINVARLRRSAFVICSLMAALGGVVAVSHANSVDANTGGINVLLYAIAAAVIGGTSLFGGTGRVVGAVLGGTLMAVIDNGMALLGLSAGVKYIVACVFLLLAAGLDVLPRLRAADTLPAAGRDDRERSLGASSNDRATNA
jgi:D-xylose transport system permease protein